MVTPSMWFVAWVLVVARVACAHDELEGDALADMHTLAVDPTATWFQRWMSVRAPLPLPRQRERVQSLTDCVLGYRLRRCESCFSPHSVRTPAHTSATGMC